MKVLQDKDKRASDSSLATLQGFTTLLPTRATQKEERRRVFSANVSHAWNTLRTMLRDAEMLVGMPCTASENFRFAVKAPKTTNIKDTLTRDELVALLAQTEHESPDIRAMIWVMATTGVRFGELAGLEWEDIDFDDMHIQVRRSAVDGQVFPTKTCTNRTVPLYPNVAAILKEHRHWLESRLIRNREEVVFPSRVGSYRLPATLQRPLVRCAQKAGLSKHVTNQTLRRTVNNLIRQTAGEIAARAITGHATQAMTEHYSDVTMDEKHNAGKNALGWELIGELPSPAKKAETVFFSEKEHASSRVKTHSHGPAESSAGFCAGLAPKSTAEEEFDAFWEEENPVNQQ